MNCKSLRMSFLILTRVIFPKGKKVTFSSLGMNYNFWEGTVPTRLFIRSDRG
jgi:hypothetical protein